MEPKIKSPVAILGFGVEGKYSLDYLLKKGIKDITVFDEKEPEIPEEMKNSADFRTGEKTFEGLDEFATIIRSPGVQYDRPEIRQAKEGGATITSMTELTLQIGRERVTAITGSNGKTTTTGLIAAILKKHYKEKVIVGGNDRTPILGEAIERPKEPIVMEVSSFQFADLEISPHISAILNITPNHMDWHADLEDYIHAKNNLIKHQKSDDWAVLNANNENSARLSNQAPGRIFWINKKRGESWAIWENDNIVINNTPIAKKSDVKVKTHPDNILFAAAIATLHEVPFKTIVETLLEFPGVEHRLEFVREIRNIRFYNDSACTTPESAEVAIDQFPEGNLILLLGGSTKHADFNYLANKIQKKNVRVYLYGNEGEKIKFALESIGAENAIIGYDETRDFKTIIQSTLNEAIPEDNIVLSPACASFDMFKNAKERGKLFKEIVMGL